MVDSSFLLLLTVFLCSFLKIFCSENVQGFLLSMYLGIELLGLKLCSILQVKTIVFQFTLLPAIFKIFFQPTPSLTVS